MRRSTFAAVNERRADAFERSTDRFLEAALVAETEGKPDRCEFLLRQAEKSLAAAERLRSEPETVPWP